MSNVSKIVRRVETKDISVTAKGRASKRGIFLHTNANIKRVTEVECAAVFETSLFQ